MCRAVREGGRRCPRTTDAVNREARKATLAKRAEQTAKRRARAQRYRERQRAKNSPRPVTAMVETLRAQGAPDHDIAAQLNEALSGSVPAAFRSDAQAALATLTVADTTSTRDPRSAVSADELDKRATEREARMSKRRAMARG